MGVASTVGLALGLAASQYSGVQVASLGGPPSSWPTPDKVCRVEITDGAGEGALATIVSACEVDLRLAPDDAIAHIQRGIAYFHLEDYVSALKDFSAARAMAPDRADVLVYLGLTAKRMGQTDTAVGYYTNALAIDPHQTSALINRSALLIDARRFKDASRDLTLALTARPQDPGLYMRRGFARLNDGDFAGAEADYSAALEIKPAAEAYRFRGVARRNLGRIADAIADYDAALALEPGDTGVLLSRAVAWHFSGKDESAIADCSAVLKQEPQNSDALVLRAQSLKTLGRLKDAVADYSAALKVAPGNADALAERASLYYALGQDQDAVADVNRAVKIGVPDTVRRATVLYTRGMATMRLSRGVEGKADIAAAQALDPAVDRQASNLAADPVPPQKRGK